MNGSDPSPGQPDANSFFRAAARKIPASSPQRPPVRIPGAAQKNKAAASKRGREFARLLRTKHHSHRARAAPPSTSWSQTAALRERGFLDPQSASSADFSTSGRVPPFLSTRRRDGGSQPERDGRFAAAAEWAPVVSLR